MISVDSRFSSLFLMKGESVFEMRSLSIVAMFGLNTEDESTGNYQLQCSSSISFQ